MRLNRKINLEALCKSIRIYETKILWMMFCRTKSRVDAITNKLKAQSDADAYMEILHKLRQKALDLFKKKVLTILVATDVAARGIDK